MKINSLEISNFLAIGEIDVRLDDRGLVLVEGENQDDTSQNSNGSGKSSFPDAISWCLFGVTARGETGDKIINRTAKKGTRVSIRIDDGGTMYQIARHRKHKVNKNRLQILQWEKDKAEWVDLTLGTDRETQLRVNKLIGCSPSVFNAAIYAGQDCMPDLPSMTDKELKQLVEEGAGIEQIQAAHTLALSQFRDKERAGEELLRKAELIDSNLESTKEDISFAEANQSDFESNRVLRCNGIKAKHKEASDRYYEKRDAVKAIEIPDHSARIAEIDEKVGASKAMQAKSDEKMREAREAAENKKDLEKDLRSNQELILKLEKQLENIQARIGKPCGECGKPTEEHDLDDVRNSILRKIEGEKREAKATANGIEHWSGEYDECNALWKRALAEVPDVADLLNERNALALETAKAVNARDAALNEAKRVAAEVEHLKSQYDSAKSEANPHVATLARLSERLASLETTRTAMEEKRLESLSALSLAAAVVRVFSPSGVRAHILDTVTPFLNERTNHYLSTLTDGNISAVWSTLTKLKSGEYAEKFSIDVESVTGAESFGGLSGGEKRKVRLACSMALQDLVASRASKPISLFIADEIDHALDESGLERLMSILEEKASTRGTVLAISHNSLSDWIRQSVTVVKKGGRSTLVGEALHAE